MDQGEPTSKIEQHKLHLKDLKERYLLAQSKLDAQKKVVKKAEEAVEVARKDYQQKEKELEKLHIHKSEWVQAMKLEEQKKEDVNMDDISTSAYTRKKRSHKWLKLAQPFPLEVLLVDLTIRLLSKKKNSNKR